MFLGNCIYKLYIRLYCSIIVCAISLLNSDGIGDGSGQQSTNYIGKIVFLQWHIHNRHILTNRLIVFCVYGVGNIHVLLTFFWIHIA